MRPIGAGGMAVVYEAVRLGDGGGGDGGGGSRVVIKRLLPHFVGDPGHIKMMAAEAEVVSRLHHPGIVELFELGEAKGEWFLAMELVDGVDLAKVVAALAVRSERLPVPLACLVTLRLAEALDYAHRLTGDDGRPLGVVHRDLSPSNVMIASSGAVKLLDFGIARAEGLEVDRTKTGTIKGKLTYMAPEQLDGARADARSDLFSLGVVLHELLTGQRLFKAESDVAIIKLRSSPSRIPAPSERGAVVPAVLDGLVSAMLAIDPAGRPSSCEAVADALRLLAGDERALAELVARLAPARAAALHPTVATTSLAAPPLTRTTHEVPAPTRRLAWTLAALAVTVFGALGLAMSWALRPGTGPTVAVAATPRPLSASGASTERDRETELDAPAAAPDAEHQGAAEQPPPAPRPSSNVRLRLSGPAGARVAIDGVNRGALPLELTLPRSEARHRIVVSRAGAEPFITSVSGTADASVEVAFKRRARAVQRPGGTRSEIADPFR